MSFIVTPKCPICRQNYCTDIRPTVLYPCGHGMCNECIESLREHEEEQGNEDVKCPVCREIIVQDFLNYDLVSITDQVRTDSLTYWSKRLVENIALEGYEIELHPQVEAFSKVICIRMAYSDLLNDVEDKSREYWSKEELIMVTSFKKIFVHALRQSNIVAKDALSWMQVLCLPTKIEKLLLREVVNFYESKAFLAPMKAEWLLDIFL